jgi:hypothetical protein
LGSSFLRRTDHEACPPCPLGPARFWRIRQIIGAIKTLRHAKEFRANGLLQIGIIQPDQPLTVLPAKDHWCPVGLEAQGLVAPKRSEGEVVHRTRRQGGLRDERAETRLQKPGQIREYQRE